MLGVLGVDKLIILCMAIPGKICLTSCFNSYYLEISDNWSLRFLANEFLKINQTNIQSKIS